MCFEVLSQLQVVLQNHIFRETVDFIRFLDWCRRVNLPNLKLGLTLDRCCECGAETQTKNHLKLHFKYVYYEIFSLFNFPRKFVP